MGHRTGAGGNRLTTLRAAAAAVVTIVGTVAAPAAAWATPPVGTVTLQPASGNADTRITATFHLRRDDDDDARDCDLTTS